MAWTPEIFIWTERKVNRARLMCAHCAEDGKRVLFYARDEHCCTIVQISVLGGGHTKYVRNLAVDCDVQIGMVEAVDLFGKSSLIAYPVENFVDLSAIGVGIYILKVFNTSQQLIGSIKIVKISA